MRIVTFNTHHGLTPGAMVDTGALASYCAGLGADVLALQEIDVRARRSGGADQAAAVAEATGMTAYFGPARRMGARGRYGNVLLVRGRIDSPETLALPRSGRHERRSAILAGVTVDDRRLSVAATHLSVHPDEAGPQLAAVLGALRRHRPPRVVLGDFNLRPEQVGPALAEHRAYALAHAAVPTFPAITPRLRIDHVVIEGLDVESVDVLDAGPVSDHRALVVEVR